MRGMTFWAVMLPVALLSACAPAPAGVAPPEPSAGSGPVAASPPTQAPTAAPVTPAPAGQAAPGQGPGPRRRPPPDPAVQDSLRRNQVDSILKVIAGRELQPAGQVFKNVQLLKDMPAGEFVRQMDTNYGRGLGWTCNNCHTIGEFDSDTKKNKRIARQMQEMTLLVNQQELPKVKELDAEYEKVTCVMCHRGSNEPKGTMPVPAGPPAGPGSR
jgi:hypothetical protein